jgi:hypothetical protein
MANHSWAKHPPATTIPSTRRRLSVYDGRLWLGDFVWNEKTQQALTWDASRRFIGQFGSYRAAARAIGQHAAARRQGRGIGWMILARRL